MPRPFWSGQMQLSLVSFGIRLFPATEAKSEIHFHQLSRKTGERVHHQKVAGGSGSDIAIEKDDIVKGYEYRRGEYVTVEPAELEHLRLPSRNNISITQCVDLSEMRPELIEKPYFVLPDGDNQIEAFTVIRQALRSTRKAALGKIAFGGREHLIAIAAPPKSRGSDSSDLGMMAYTLRYAEELRDPSTYFSEIKKAEIDEEQLSLAKELIQRKSSAFSHEKFHDEYETALKEMLEAKVNHLPVPKDEVAPRAGKVIHLMDALRKSVGSIEPVRADSDSVPSNAKRSAGPVEMKKTRVPAKPDVISKSVRSRKSA